jgi:adenosine deaminase
MTSPVTPIPERDLAALPKGHLHLHFEAAIRRETLRELAASAGIEVPPIGTSVGFEQFAAIFMAMISVLSLPGALRRVVIENAEDARADGVVYLELAVSPQFYAATYGGAESALAELAAAASEARTITGVEVALMVTLDRTDPVDEAIELARLAASFAGRGVVSVGLANNEVGHPAAHFLPAFAIARAAGLVIAPHAGELLGPESVAEALDIVGADRIQHGVRVIEDPALLARLAASGVCLDVCPTSNAVLGIVSELSAHPLPGLLAAGVECSINADDPTIFGPGVLDEYRTARATLGLTDDQLAACATTSIRHSSASDDVREAALAGIAAWLASDPREEHAP